MNETADETRVEAAGERREDIPHFFALSLTQFAPAARADAQDVSDARPLGGKTREDDFGLHGGVKQTVREEMKHQEPHSRSSKFVQHDTGGTRTMGRRDAPSREVSICHY